MSFSNDNTSHDRLDTGESKVEKVDTSDDKDLVEAPNLVKRLLKELEQEETTIVVSALYSLSDFICTSDDYDKRQVRKHEATKLGIHKSVISVMTKFPDDKDIQAKGCACLVAFCYDAVGKDFNLNCDILKEGGMDLVVKALVRFPDCARIQEYGFGALTNMFSGIFNGLPSNRRFMFGCPGGRSTPERISEVSNFFNIFSSNLSGIEITKKAMKAFPEEASLQRNAVLLLSTLANSSSQCKAVVQKSKAGSFVGAALDNHPKNGKVASAVLDYFKAMTQ